ncbi:MAG: hypothetical protein LBU51_05070 [Bacteroidales bacterium]|jgi:hypothetical protein|nr:hypothetical protein [Bacteroidales bacterium]
MENKQEEKKSKKKGKLKKYLCVAIIFIALASIIAHFVWKASGSDQWDVISDKDGVKVYSMKTPGETWLKFKVTGKVNASMKTIVRFIRDPNAADDVGIYDTQLIDSISPQLIYYSFKQKFFFPFEPREYVVESNFHQDTITKAVYVDFIADPEKIPEDPNCGCFRVTKMNNKWLFTPYKNGDVDYEFVSVAEDPGGNFPYFIANIVMSIIYADAFAIMPETINKPKYQNAQIDYVRDYE